LRLAALTLAILAAIEEPPERRRRAGLFLIKRLNSQTSKSKTAAKIANHIQIGKVNPKTVLFALKKPPVPPESMEEFAAALALAIPLGLETAAVFLLSLAVPPSNAALAAFNGFGLLRTSTAPVMIEPPGAFLINLPSIVFPNTVITEYLKG
jgi:hypothetical protein